MHELTVSVDQLVDIAVATPRVGVLDLAALHSLLHIIVRKLNLENYEVQFTTNSDRAKKFQKSRPAIAINEYTAGKLVQRNYNPDPNEKSTIKVKHRKKKFDQDEREIVSNILDEIVDEIFESRRRITRIPQSILWEVVDGVLVSRRPADPSGGYIIGNKSSVQLTEVVVNDMIGSAIGETDADRKTRKLAAHKRKMKKEADSGTIGYWASESNVSHDKKFRAKVKRKLKSNGQSVSTSTITDSFDDSDPMVRTSQIGPMVDHILQGKKPKKRERKSDLFDQFEQLIKQLDTTEGSENRLEFKGFLQNLLDELKTKTEKYLQEVQVEREMQEKPTARDLNRHIETQVSSTFIDSTSKPRDDGFDSDSEKRQQRSKWAKMMKGFHGKEASRFCGGEHTAVPSVERNTPKTNFKEKYIDLIASQMKDGLRNAGSVPESKVKRCCNDPNCTCYHVNTLSAVYGIALS